MKFIIQARKETYASGKEPKTGRGKSYLIKKENFEYQDVYYDQKKIFQGQEVVFHQGTSVWTCSYRGVVQEGYDAREVFRNLKKCLKDLVSVTRFHTSCNLPFEKWKYDCKGNGNFEEFSGKEAIYYNNTLAYWLVYFGGIIK